MRKIFFAIGAAALLLGSCTKDKGNYDYTQIDAPVVALSETPYQVPFGENFVLAPKITWSGDLSKTIMRYSFYPDGDSNVAPYYVDAKADGSIDARLELSPGNYSVRLEIRVPDDSGINTDAANPGMVYYFPFTLTLGTTQFSNGTMVLVDDGGQAKLHFIMPDGEIVEDVYLGVNGEALPGKPLQILFPRVFTSGVENGWLVFTDNGGQLDGAILSPNELLKVRSIEESFIIPPLSRANMGKVWEPVSFMGQWTNWGTFTMPLDGKVFFTPVSPMGLYQDGYYSFGPALSGDYYVSEMVPSYAMGHSFPAMWGWDSVKKRMWLIQTGQAGLKFDLMPNVMDASPVWNPANVGLDLVTMQTYTAGGWIIASDGTNMFQLGWAMPTATMMMGLTKAPFNYASMITADTKWIVDRNMGYLFFSSGNKVYMYNPTTGAAPEPLVANLEGDVTMLRFRTTLGGPAPQMYATQYNFNILEVGTEGHLYELDFSGTVGSRGTIKKDTPINGSPVDLFRREF